MENSWREGLRRKTLNSLSRMRTISFGIYVGVASSIALASFLFSSDATARRETIQYPVVIERGAVTISNKDRIAIANLMIDSRNGFTKNGPIVIYAYTDEAQPGGVALTERRVASASEYLRTLGVSTDRINVEYNVWRRDTRVSPADRYQLLFELLPGEGFHD